MYRDDIVKRDMSHIRSLNPNTITLERWMREKGYNGGLDKITLKVIQDHDTVHVNMEKKTTL